MCGRYGYSNTNKEKIKKAFRLKQIAFDLVPRYNITPGQDVPVILNETPQELTLARWGLVPFWAKEEKIGYKMINARSETIFEKPAFRSSIKKKRCLILADFFFEWKRTEDKKQPFCIRLQSQETLAFAGIWDCWEKGENALVSCSIITCEPNTLMKTIHDRMPVILDSEGQSQWLGESDPDKVKEMLTPFSPALMEAYPISTMVNSPSNQNKEILDPV